MVEGAPEPDARPEVGHAGVPSWIKIMWALGLSWMATYVAIGLSEPFGVEPRPEPPPAAAPPLAPLRQLPPTPLLAAVDARVSNPLPTRGAAKPAVPAAQAPDVGALFQSRCASCHGARGAGDGPVAAALQPKPRDFRDRAWQTAMTDAQLARVIVEGGLGVGKSPLMPASPDLAKEPGVVSALVQVIRRLGAP
jgi:mono/diheme cytochrome c family protein